MIVSDNVLARFWAKVDRLGDCWVWTAGGNGNGYGTFWTGERREYAHRFSFLVNKGEIPEGLEIHHTCRNRACVNPAHLLAVTHRDNVIDGNTIAARVHNTHCIHGHEYTPENTRIRANGTRNCRTCASEQRQRKRKEQQC